LFAAEPTTPVTVDPTDLPVAVTPAPTAPVADGAQLELQPAGGDDVDPVGATATGATRRGDSGRVAAIRVAPRSPRAEPAGRALPGGRALLVAGDTRSAAAATASRRPARDMPAAWVRLTTTEAGAVVLATCGQPLNATTALAVTNTSAAPATSDPAVPNPAT
jgi:hypothetical protein